MKKNNNKHVLTYKLICNLLFNRTINFIKLIKGC